MNYRHAFHAGNFADVMKHTALVLLLGHLQRKESPFFVLDTHAGRGGYDLLGIEAFRTEEAQTGIGRLWSLPQESAYLENYLQIVRCLNAEGELRFYPGSPQIIETFLRDQDRALFFERHPEECQALKRLLGRKRQAHALCEDGWQALKARLPPKERRGLVLIDPPYEQENEAKQLVNGLKEALKRFANGIYLAWYPVKGSLLSKRLAKDLSGLPEVDVLQLELHLRKPNHPKRLDGSGLIVINPPWQFEEKMGQILGVLSSLFALSADAGASINWLVRKQP